MNAATPKPAAPEAKIKAEATKEIKLPSAALSVDASSDGSKLYAACFDGVYEIDAASGKGERFARHESYASGIWLLEKSQTLISAGYDGVLQWHEWGSKKLIRKAQAHRFWSWKLAVSPDEKWVASVTGQYLPGGYQYEPAAEQEPSVRVYDAATGELRHSFAHQPPVLSAAISPDSRYLAAANMMGETRVWDLQTGSQVSAWSTGAFTSWGIIKSHHYIGGIYALTFSPNGEEILVGGMGTMRDPMSGNGKQTWQRFGWRDKPARKLGEIDDNERGNGLMETLAFHPSENVFLMAGRMAQGKWNTAFFDSNSGKLLYSLDTKMRVTDACFTNDGTKLFLSGAVGQEKKKDGKCPEFGRIKVLSCVS